MNAKWMKLLSASGAMLAVTYTFGEIKPGRTTKDVPSVDVDLYKLDLETIKAEKDELRSMMELIQKRLDRIQKIEARLEEAKHEEVAFKQPVPSGPQAIQLPKKEVAQRVTLVDNAPVTPQKAIPVPQKPVKSERSEVVTASTPVKTPTKVDRELSGTPTNSAVSLPPSVPVMPENLQPSEGAAPTKSFSPVKEPIIPARELKKPERPFSEEVPQAAKEKLEPVKAQSVVPTLPNSKDEVKRDRSGGALAQDELLQVLAEIRAMTSREDDDFSLEVDDAETSVFNNMAPVQVPSPTPQTPQPRAQYPSEQEPVKIPVPVVRSPLPSPKSPTSGRETLRDVSDVHPSDPARPTEKKALSESPLSDKLMEADLAEDEIDLADTDMVDFEGTIDD